MGCPNIQSVFRKPKAQVRFKYPHGDFTGTIPLSGYTKRDENRYYKGCPSVDAITVQLTKQSASVQEATKTSQPGGSTKSASVNQPTSQPGESQSTNQSASVNQPTSQPSQPGGFQSTNQSGGSQSTPVRKTTPTSQPGGSTKSASVNQPGESTNQSPSSGQRKKMTANEFIDKWTKLKHQYRSKSIRVMNFSSPTDETQAGFVEQNFPHSIHCVHCDRRFTSSSTMLVHLRKYHQSYKRRNYHKLVWGDLVFH